MRSLAMSASLIGRLGSSAFRLSTSTVSMSLIDGLWGCPSLGATASIFSSPFRWPTCGKAGGEQDWGRCLHPCLRPLPACVFAPCHVTLAAMRRCLRHRPPCSPSRCLGPDLRAHAFRSRCAMSRTCHATAPLMRSCLQGPGRAPHDHPHDHPRHKRTDKSKLSWCLRRCVREKPKVKTS